MRQDSCPKLFVYDAKPLAVFTIFTALLRIILRIRISHTTNEQLASP
jgi:hypothetical protein